MTWKSAAEFAKHPSERRAHRWAGRPGRRFSEEALGSQNQAAFSTDPRPSLRPPAPPPRIPNAQRPAGLGHGASGVTCSRGTGEVTCGGDRGEVTCGRGTQRSSSARSALSPCPLPLPPLRARGCASLSRRPGTTHQMASLSAGPPDSSREPEPKRSHPTPPSQD